MFRQLRSGRLVLLCLLAWSATHVAAEPEDPSRLTVPELRERLQSGELTAVAVTDAYLARIAALDDQGPTLNAVLATNPDAPAIAAALDERPRPKGPLHGVPVILKDNIDTGDRMATTAGSLALEDHRAPHDAHLVARLRDAGAVIIGKANMSEWANFRSRRSSSGWSSAGGQTRNPHVLDRNPCGSSSGSAVAVAARLAPLAVGTETDGSIVCPAGVNGIVGIKPTVGIVSRRGLVPISHTQDTAGPMARTVTGAALLLSVLVGHDPADPGSKVYPHDPSKLLPDPGRTRLDGLRIGVFRDYYGAGQYPTVEDVYHRALATLQALGATLVDPVEHQVDDALFDADYQVMLHEFKAGLNAYLASHPVPEDRNSLADLIAWNQAHADRVMPFFGQGIFLAAEATAGLDAPAYEEALAAGPERARRDLTTLLRRHRLDALVTVANSFAWKTDWLAGDRFLVGSSSLAAIPGFPNVTVPAGHVSQLPVNVSFIAEPFAEPMLIRIAYAFEQATGALREPRFLPTVEAEAALSPGTTP